MGPFGGLVFKGMLWKTEIKENSYLFSVYNP